MANDVEVFEDFASNGLPATGIGTLLRFEAGDGSVVQPFRRDWGDQRRCVPRRSADRALDQGHRSWRRRDEAEAQAGRHALRECRYVDRELRRESGDRGGASREERVRSVLDDEKPVLASDLVIADATPRM